MISGVLFSSEKPNGNDVYLTKNEHKSFPCDVKTTRRADGNIMKYFNPFPVVQNDKYDVGTSVYKNITTGEYTISVAVLFKNIKAADVSGNLILKTKSNIGLSLKQFMNTRSEVNGNSLSLAIYVITDRDFEILRNSPVNQIYVDVQGSRLGGSFNSLSEIYMKEIECLIYE